MEDEADFQSRFASCIATAPKLLGTTAEKQQYCHSVAHGGAGNAGKMLYGAGVAMAPASASASASASAPTAASWEPPVSSSSAYGYSCLPSPFTAESHLDSRAPYVQGTRGKHDDVSAHLRGSQGAQRVAVQDSQISGITPRQKLFGRHGAEHTLNHSFNNGRGCAW